MENGTTRRILKPTLAQKCQCTFLKTISSKVEVTNERLVELANIGAGLIQLQLTLASQIPDQAMIDRWVLGYCFGVFDALVQRHNLDQYTDGIALITFGFQL